MLAKKGPVLLDPVRDTRAKRATTEVLWRNRGVNKAATPLRPPAAIYARSLVLRCSAKRENDRMKGIDSLDVILTDFVFCRAVLFNKRVREKKSWLIAMRCRPRCSERALPACFGCGGWI